MSSILYFLIKRANLRIFLVKSLFLSKFIILIRYKLVHSVVEIKKVVGCFVNVFVVSGALACYKTLLCFALSEKPLSSFLGVSRYSRHQNRALAGLKMRCLAKGGVGVCGFCSVFGRFFYF